MPSIGPALYWIETAAACPTSRTFQVKLDNGDIVSVSMTTLRNHRRLGTSIHRPSNSEINQSVIHLANHQQLKDF